MKPCRDQSPAGPDLAAAADCRCLCGSLLARVVEGAVELKCRRCKRTLRVPFDDAIPNRAAERHPIEVIPARQTG
jgi:hypothetical protein